MIHQPQLYKYPAHADDFFIVATEPMMKLMLQLLIHYNGHMSVIIHTGDYHTLVDESIALLKRLQAYLHYGDITADVHDLREHVDLNPRLCISRRDMDAFNIVNEDSIIVSDSELLNVDGTIYGPELLGDTYLPWVYDAVTSLLERVNFEVVDLRYGCTLHEIWNSFLLD